MEILLTTIGLIIVSSLVSWFYLPEMTGRILLKIGRTFVGLQRKSVTVNGIEWIYLDSGSSAKPIIVMVHGYGGDKDNWLTYAPRVSKQYRIIAPDLPGFGDSTKDTSLDYSLPAQAKRLHDFIAVLGFKKVHLVGNSMGGGIAGFFALEFPNTLLSLSFFNSVGVFPKTATSQGELGKIMQSGDNSLIAMNMPEMRHLFGMATFKKQRIPYPILKLSLRNMKKNNSLLTQIFSELSGNQSINELTVERLSQIRVPTLVLWGKEDKIINVACAHIKAKHIVNSTLVLLDNIGHIPMVEAPTLTASHYLNFLESLSGLDVDQ